MQARQAGLKLYYTGVDISKDLASHLKSWTYTDNASGQSDDLQISLEDRKGLWLSDWFPSKGDQLSASIVSKNFKADQQYNVFDVGVFEIDEIEAEDPSNVTIKALAIPEGSGSLRSEEKNKAWENISLSGLAKDIANSNSMGTFFDSEYDPFYDRIEQTDQADLEFLQKLCDDASLSLKIGEGKIIIFDDIKYEQQEPITTIDRSQYPRTKYQAKTTLNEVYSSCVVEYTDASQKETLKYTFAPPNPPATSKVLRVNQRVKSLEQAEALAKRSLHKENAKETSFDLTIPGSTQFLAALTVMLTGWGAFDGKYLISQAVHSQEGKYEVKLQLRKCLEGY